MIETIERLPAEFEFINDLINDANWLILSEIQRRGILDEGKVEYPREINIKISIARHPERLPVQVAQTIKIGRFYDKTDLREYSSKGDMGLPDWYYTNPLEYWDEEASVDYLQVKPELV